MIGPMTDPMLPLLGKAAASTAGRVAPSLLGRLTLRWRVARAVNKLARDRGWALSLRALRRSIKPKEMFEELLDSRSDHYPKLLNAARMALVRPCDAHTIQQLATLIADEFVRRLPPAESGRAHTSRQTAKVLGQVRDLAGIVEGLDASTRSQGGGEPLALRNGGRVSNLHLIPRTTGLVVREDVDARCRAVLAESRLLVLSGPQGTGKSVTAGQLAMNSARRVRWWIDGHSEESIEIGVDSLLRALGLGAQSTPLDELRRVLSDEEDIILVVDNVVDANRLYALIPAQLTATVIATTTNPLVADEGSSVPIGTLTPDQGNELLRRLAFDASDDNAAADGINQLTEALGQSPLAIRQAAAYMRASGLSPLALWDRLTISPRKVLALHAPSDYPDTIARVHELARDSVVRQERAAKDVLTLLAISGPGGISRQLLSVCEDGSAEELQLDRALSALSQAGLAQVSVGRVTCHSLTAAFERESARPWRRRALAVRVAMYAEVLGTKGELEDIDVALSALAALLDAANLRGSKDTYHRLAILAVAVKEDRLQAAVSLTRDLRKALGRQREDDPYIVELLLLEAGFLIMLGHPRRALAPAEEAATRSVASGDITSTVQALAIASSCQSQLGNRDESIRLLQQAISTIPASDHKTRDLLYVQMAQLEARSAEPAEEADRILAIRGTVHTGTAEWALLSTLAGRALATAGDAQRAIELTKGALAVDRELFGEESLPVARDMNDLGNAYVALGELDQAENRLERSRDIYRQISADEHSHIGMPTLNLGRIALMRAEASETDEEREALFADATILFEEAVRLNSAEGSEGTDLASAFIALGDTLMHSPKREDHSIALGYFRRAVAIDGRELGADHAQVVVDLLREASALLSLEDYEKMAEVLDRVDAVLGSDRGLPESRIEATFLRIQLEVAQPSPDVVRVRGLARRLIRAERDPKLPLLARAHAKRLIDRAPILRTLARPQSAAPGASFFRTPRQPDVGALDGEKAKAAKSPSSQNSPSSSTGTSHPDS
jgi:tetratricopeptide (TPR) repeat protein